MKNKKNLIFSYFDFFLDQNLGPLQKLHLEYFSNMTSENFFEARSRPLLQSANQVQIQLLPAGPQLLLVKKWLAIEFCAPLQSKSHT
jgi:hypothetical protein